MIIPDNHISITSGEQIRTICAPLFEKNAINFFIYCRFYDDGTLISLPSHTEWHKHFMDKEYFSNKHRMKVGLHLWAAQKKYSQANIEAREYFNIDNKFEIVERGKDYYDVYGFGSSKNNNQIIDYYLNNIDFLKKFSFYFKNMAKKIIDASNKKENRLFIGHQIITPTQTENIEPIDDFMRNRIRHYYINTENLVTQHLTAREMEVSIYILQQRSATETASILNISPKTVETYLASAKEKLGCVSRAELFDILQKNGLLQLIKLKN